MFYEQRQPQLRTRKLVEIQVDNFNGGTNVLFSETRLKKNEAKETLNLLLIEDGVWTKRWGTKQYGVTFTNTIDGFTEYVKDDGTTELIVVADGKCYRMTTTNKTEITGATFTQGSRCEFIQIKSELYITNGVDPIARYDGSTLATYSSLDTPVWDGTPISRGGGLSSGSFTYYYRISAVNAIGETIANAEESIAVNKDRDAWVVASNENVVLGWADVTGALKYVVYFSDTSGYEVKLAEVLTSTYTDDGTAIPNPYIEPRDDNTTTGPTLTSLCISGNRIWGTGDPDNPWRVYWTGVGANLGNFAPAYGGGWVDLEKGSRNTTVKAVDYQGEVHVFCKSPDGRGTIWRITLDFTTIGDTSVVVPTPKKIIASTGTSAVRSVVYVENDILFFNPRGVHVLGNEPGILDVLRANELSSRVRPYIRGLSGDSVDKVCAYYKDAKVFFSVPTSTGEPDRILVYDRERLAWIKDWSIGVSQFGEYTDSAGTIHFLGIMGNKLVEFSENYQTDDGDAFTWRYVSPRFAVSEDWRSFAHIARSYVRVRTLKGSPTFAVYGTGYEKTFSQLGTGAIQASSSNTGIGWDLVGDFLVGDTNGFPSSFAQESLIKYIDIDTMLRDIQFEVSGDGVEDNAVIIGLAASGKLKKVSHPDDWRLSTS